MADDKPAAEDGDVLNLDLKKKKKKKFVLEDDAPATATAPAPTEETAAAPADTSASASTTAPADAVDDLSLDMKKKKKKKKFTLDEEGGEGTSAAGPEATETSASTATASTEPQGDATAPADAIDDLSLDMKKKKKKKKTALEPIEGQDEPEESTAAGGDAEAAAEGEDSLSIELSKKKKKKKTKTLDGAEGADGEAAEEVTSNNEAADYTYAQLLGRIFDIMRQKNPDMSGETKPMTFKPPQVHRLGTRRTAFANFTECCKQLGRPADHLQSFLVAELGANASVDGSAALVMRGRFQQKQIENVLRRYIREYVTCHTCKSLKTEMKKENRLFFLICETCGSRCSVASIRAGFQAVTGKRAAMRAKTEA